MSGLVTRFRAWARTRLLSADNLVDEASRLVAAAPEFPGQVIVYPDELGVEPAVVEEGIHANTGRRVAADPKAGAVLTLRPPVVPARRWVVVDATGRCRSDLEPWFHEPSATWRVGGQSVVPGRGFTYFGTSLILLES